MSSSNVQIPYVYLDDTLIKEIDTSDDLRYERLRVRGLLGDYFIDFAGVACRNAISHPPG